VYLLPFWIGLFGFLALFGLSFGHVGHGHADGGHAGHGGHGSHGHAPSGHVHSASHAGSHAGSHHGLVKAIKFVKGGSNWLSLFSPLAIFSICLGFGATGILLEHRILKEFVLPAAIAGGVGFNYLLNSVITNLLMKYASNPSEGLEGMVAKLGKATSNFDQAGYGVIELVIDQQTVQVLARLDPSEVSEGVRVRKGDNLLVTEVDAAKNQCRVTRELAS
jgi:hypothetical protein